jgi:hypothetical protein
MLNKVSMLLVVTLIGLSVIPSGSKKPQTKAAHFWAAITINHPLQFEGWTNQIVFDFAVFNDGGVPIAVNPCINRSTFIINGAPLAGKDVEWFSFNLGNGPRTIDPLPPGQGTYIEKGDFGQPFQKPGVYSVVWKSDCFESPPLVFRVMPREDKKPPS